MLHTQFYYIPITDTIFELSIFWPSDTENWINELRFSDLVSLSFKTSLTSAICFCVGICNIAFKHGTRGRKHDDVSSRNAMS